MDGKGIGNLGAGWDRAQLSLRLTPERRQQLLRLRAGLDGEPTPTDALDKALSLALEPRDEHGGGVDRDELEGAVRAGVADLRGAIERHSASIKAISDGLLGLHRVLSEAVDGDDARAAEPGESAEAEPPTPFADWLASALRRSGSKVQRVAIAKSTWQRRTEVAPRFSALDVTAELIAVDGKLVAGSPPFPELARLDLLDSAGAICGARFPQPIFLVCQALASGWTVHVHRATAEGQPGEAIGSHRV